MRFAADGDHLAKVQRFAAQFPTPTLKVDKAGSTLVYFAAYGVDLAEVPQFADQALDVQ
ncbi:MAG: hypothetical protein KA436_07045 [Oligoflexales bacterium]|nr:hypothetical protein [Oligoflexales bacterium]